MSVAQIARCCNNADPCACCVQDALYTLVAATDEALAEGLAPVDGAARERLEGVALMLMSDGGERDG